MKVGISIPCVCKYVWPKLDRFTTWVLLSRLRNSFLARAISALSLSSLLLANLQGAMTFIGADLSSLKLVLFGAVLFLSGYLLFGLWVPPEFSRPAEIHEHVESMLHLADVDFVASRYEMSERLLKRMQQVVCLSPPGALVIRLHNKLSSKTDASEIETAAKIGLFHADLTLRQHDFQVRRLIVSACMVGGVFCLFFPTLVNVLKVVWSP